MCTKLGGQRIRSRGLKEAFWVAIHGVGQDIPERRNSLFGNHVQKFCGSCVRFGEEWRLEMMLNATSLKTTAAWVQEYFFTLTFRGDSPNLASH